jgi:decaprenyl-phosphate phosphoribosyltransferase
MDVKYSRRIPAGFYDYLSIARPDNWFKNAFILPGMIVGYTTFHLALTKNLLISCLFVLIAACFITSANYVLNEWLDADYDKYHPSKKHRPFVQKELNPLIVYIEYIILALSGLTIAFSISISIFWAAVLLLVMGFIYNVRPFRTKEVAYIDVLTESINNPIRFSLGWFAVNAIIFPPSSILLSYWMGGAFLMACKRFAEYRYINDREAAAAYRKSFKTYTETSLLIFIFFCALTSAFFLGIFLIKHRIELLLTFPLFSILFSWYLYLTFQPDSIAQKPEKLFTNWKFMSFIVLFFLFFLFLLFYRIEWMHYFLRNNFK